jgi:uncharacterized protein YndB with AHSA1/START domain
MSANTQFYAGIRCMIHRMSLGLALSAAPVFGLAEPLVTEGFINAAPAEVWRLFTTAEGYKATGVAQAEIDLRIGGEIRSHYDPNGRLGDAETIVNEILAYEPERMLSIRVRQAPASLPHRAALAGTWTVLYFNPAGANMTQVRIVGLGYDDSPDSQALRKFFADGNRWTLDHIAKQYWPKCASCKAD